MKILFLSSVFPNPVEASLGCFNDSLVRALAQGHEVEAISLVPWVDLEKVAGVGTQFPCTDGSLIPRASGTITFPFFTRRRSYALGTAISIGGRSEVRFGRLLGR